MPGKMITPIREVENHLTANATAMMRVLANILCRVGEMCVTEARTGHTYTDQTGNLSSSIGYAVMNGGTLVKMGYAQKVKDGDEGVSEGLAFLQSRAKAASKNGIVLIVTAGMNYAEYVEAKGYVVLSKAAEMAPSLVKELMLKLGFKVK